MRKEHKVSLRFYQLQADWIKASHSGEYYSGSNIASNIIHSNAF
jgi:hypothetical protein